MKIKYAIYLILIISSASSIGVGIYNYFSVSSQIKTRIFSGLNFTAESKAEVVETYISGFEYEAQILSDVLAVKLSKKDPNLAEITDLISSVASRASEIAHIDLISPEGVAITSSDPKKVGEDKTQKTTYIEGKKGLFFNNLHLSSGSKKPAFGVSVPIIDKNNHLLGIVLIDVNATKLYKILEKKSGFGDFGEIFVVNKDNLLVSPSKFLPDLFLKKEIAAINVKTCSTHKHDSHSTDSYGLLSQYVGLSGKSVLGTHVYMPNREWCLIAEADEKYYLLEPMNRLLFLSGTTILISLSIFFFIALSIHKIVIGPIQLIHQAIQGISRGQLKQKIEINSSNEIGDLARVFNSMSDQLINYYSDLEREVTLKTKSLSDEVEIRKSAEIKMQTMVEELQRLNKFMTDRELKMIELKKEIEELKKNKIPTS